MFLVNPSWFWNIHQNNSKTFKMLCMYVPACMCLCVRGIEGMLIVVWFYVSLRIHGGKTQCSIFPVGKWGYSRHDDASCNFIFLLSLGVILNFSSEICGIVLLVGTTSCLIWKGPKQVEWFQTNWNTQSSVTFVSEIQNNHLVNTRLLFSRQISDQANVPRCTTGSLSGYPWLPSHCFPSDSLVFWTINLAEKCAKLVRSGKITKSYKCKFERSLISFLFVNFVKNDNWVMGLLFAPFATSYILFKGVW